MGSRFVPAVLLVLLAVIHAQLWFGRGSISNVAELRQRLDDQQRANVRAQAVNDRLTAEVRDLQEGLEMVEEKARSELGMVRAHEVFVQFAR